MHYLHHAVKTDISHADNFAKVDRFSTFFHLQTQQQTLNELTIKDPTIPGYTTLRNLNVQQEAQLMLTNLRDEFGGHSRSPNIVPFHVLGIVSYCAIVTLSLRHQTKIFTILDFKKFRDLEMGVKGHSRSLRVISFDRLCMVCY